MRAIFLFLFILLNFPTIALAQPIRWSADRPLTWDDFQCRSREKRFDAGTSAMLINKYDHDKRDTTNLVVTAVFSPLFSWKKRNELGPSLLKHEQGHFDIVELYARRLRKEIKEDAQNEHTKEWLTDACRRQTRQIHRCQRKYDKQTRHSRRRKAQNRWNEKISTELAELSDYAG